MSTLWIVSNRLPFSVQPHDESFVLKPSVGGLATGLQSVREKQSFQWIGWPGIAQDGILPQQWATLTALLKQNDAIPVALTQQDIDLYYHGYANETLWPLSHYFLEKTRHRPETWEAYQKVNQRFFDVIRPLIQPSDTVWVHDYQLMLLPGMLREAFPFLKIGYFHHIPFPSFELFRTLVHQKELLTGLLGADLIGFHTYDYVRHFMSSIMRIMQLDRHLFTIPYQQRRVQVDAFPMGIDVKAFDQVKLPSKKSKYSMMLSIDRLDYSKGIPQRLLGYEHFLVHHPEYHGKVSFKLIIAPSRELLDSYEELKFQIEQKIAEINGKYGTQSWMPIWYLYQAFPQEDLLPLYQSADVMLVTPLRDGMNLVAKEYIASHRDGKGCLILSETAGASHELFEAIRVNPVNIKAIGEAIFEALTMTDREKKRRHDAMMDRIRRTNVHYWVHSFLQRLATTGVVAQSLQHEQPKSLDSLVSIWKKAKKPLLIFDYDGTLFPLQSRPDDAKPTAKVFDTLATMLSYPASNIAIVSGREGKQLKHWFGHLSLYLAGNHGRTIRKPNGHESRLGSTIPWKKDVLRILQQYMDQMPGSLIEDKAGGIAFHYRLCEPDMVNIRKGDILHTLETLESRTSMQIMLGHKVIEIKDPTVHKGIAVQKIIEDVQPDFVLIVGDDETDENMFAAAPTAHTIRIGKGKTLAQYQLGSVDELYAFLRLLLKQKTTDGQSDNKQKPAS